MDKLFIFHGTTHASKDATEIMEDSAGRWFSFNIQHDSIILIEKKGLPDHITGLPCLEGPALLSTVLRELEDAGEAMAKQVCMTTSKTS